VRYPRGVMPLNPINRDVFIAGYPLGVLVMKRNGQGACEGFGATTGRVRDLRFNRVRIGAG
jgi:hypothetical protein